MEQQIHINYSKEKNNILSYINRKLPKLLDFFHISCLDHTLEIFIYDDLSKFKNNYQKKTNKDYKNWICGFQGKNEIHLLDYENYLLTDGHQNQTKEDYLKLVIHEIIHDLHLQYNRNHGNEPRSFVYLTEGIASYLSEQYPNPSFNNHIPVEAFLNNEVVNYENYAYIIKFLIENYDHEYLLKLISNENFARKETPKIIYSIKEKQI